MHRVRGDGMRERKALGIGRVASCERWRKDGRDGSEARDEQLHLGGGCGDES